jgi:serine/threonine-protein kinase
MTTQELELDLEKIGEYEIVEVLGEGGMGLVYRAHDPGLARDVAIKVLKPELVENKEASARFLREARAAGKLQHPRVVSVFQVGEHDGRPYLVMELIDGDDLHERLQKDGALSIEQAIAATRDCIEALKAADEVGLVHRDVKPANLIQVGDRVKLTDFGLARPVDGSSDVTQTGIVVGTPSYIAPELARGKDASRLSDIYALGCTLFELLTNRRPFEGETAPEVLMKQLHEPPPDLVEHRPDAPLRLAELFERMLAKDPAARPQDYDGLLELLDRATEAPEEKTAATGVVHQAPPGSSGAVRVSGKFAAVKSETRTVMFTDIVGYTERTGSQSREEAARWLELHDQLLRPVLKAFGGNLVKTIGDAFLVTFRSPTDAVLCGTAIQDRLALHNREAPPEDRIRVRVAMSSGEVRLHKGDVLGETVNIASRLEKFAEPGDVILSDAVFATMNAAEVPLVERGAQDLKGINRKVTVYAVEREKASDLPYGGRSLPEGLDKVDPAQWIKGAASAAADQVARGTDAAARKLGVPVAAVAGLLALIVAGVVIGAMLGGGDLARIDAGEAQAVLKELKGKKEPGDQLMRGHALWKLERDDQALRAYRKAAKGDAHDDRMLENLIVALEAHKAPTAVTILAGWPSSSVEGPLKKALDDDNYYRRRHAAEALEDRGVEFDQVALGITDLNEAKTCGGRATGLRRLKKHGRAERALKAVQKASKRMPDNLCMVLEFGGAESAIQGRMK